MPRIKRTELEEENCRTGWRKKDDIKHQMLLEYLKGEEDGKMSGVWK